MPYNYAIVSALFLPHTGGVENFTDSLSDALARRGNHVTVVTSRLSLTDPEVETLDNGVRVLRLPSYTFLGGRLPIIKRNKRYRQLYDSLTSCAFDRVLVNTRFYSLSIEGLRIASAAGCSAVVLDHGSDYLTLGNPISDALIRLYEHVMTKRVKSFHPRFAGISKKSCEWLGTFGINASTVIPNAIDTRSFRECSTGRDFRKELTLRNSRKIVSFIGRLTPEKGAEQLVAAAKMLENECSVLLAGNGWLRNAILDLSVPNVHLLGNLSRGDVSALLSQSDAFCLPTRSEGFCTALLEAAAWGVPCVVPDVGGVEEVFGVEQEGVILLDCLEPASISEGIRAALSMQRAEPDNARNSWDATVDAVENAFGSMG